MNLPLTKDSIDRVYRMNATHKEITPFFFEKLLEQARIAVELKEALEWLETRVYEGKGMIEFGLTEDGDLGIFKPFSRDAIASGSTPLEAIQSAMKKEAK